MIHKPVQVDTMKQNTIMKSSKSICGFIYFLNNNNERLSHWTSPPAIVQRMQTVAPRLHHGHFAAPSFQWNLGVRMLGDGNQAVFQPSLQRLMGLGWQMTRHLWQLVNGTPSNWMLSGRLLVVSHYGSPPLAVSASHQTPATSPSLPRNLHKVPEADN